MKNNAIPTTMQHVESDIIEKETTDIVFVSNPISNEKARDDKSILPSTNQVNDLKHKSNKKEDGEICEQSDNMFVNVSISSCTSDTLHASA